MEKTDFAISRVGFSSGSAPAFITFVIGRVLDFGKEQRSTTDRVVRSIDGDFMIEFGGEKCLFNPSCVGQY